MLVEAPTSAGKPFISFTAMEEVLKKDPDSVVVYVAPTKALVNQVAAEVYSNFKDKPKLMKGVKPGTLLFGVFTRDYRLSPAKCRVLVTVPQCLEIMLMAHQNFEGWRDKVKYVIFDEVHSINNDEGAIWERLVTMIPCPFIALSATLGDTVHFRRWLSDYAGSHSQGNQPSFLHVKHNFRYSDLEKNLLVLHKAQGKFSADLRYCHPWSTFSTKEFVHGAPPDISLSPRDCLEVYLAMEEAVAKKGGPKYFCEHYPDASRSTRMNSSRANLLSIRVSVAIMRIKLSAVSRSLMPATANVRFPLTLTLIPRNRLLSFGF
jgi:ATP-dependent RNA helicase DDX60